MEIDAPGRVVPGQGTPPSLRKWKGGKSERDS